MLQIEAKPELIFITGWQGGARQVVVAISRLVPENKDVGASVQ